MPRMYAYAGAVPWVDFDARLALASFYLNDQATAETSRRFDRMETLFAEVKADLGEVKAEIGGVKADLAELTSTVNRIDARVEQQAAWIADDETKAKGSRR